METQSDCPENVTGNVVPEADQKKNMEKSSLKNKVFTKFTSVREFATSKFKKTAVVPQVVADVAANAVNTATTAVTDTARNATAIVTDTAKMASTAVADGAKSARETLEVITQKKKAKTPSEKLDDKIKMGFAMSNFWIRNKLSELKGKIE